MSYWIEATIGIVLVVHLCAILVGIISVAILALISKLIQKGDKR